MVVAKRDIGNKKRRFIIPMTIFFMIFYFLLPIFTSYTTFLNTPAIGDISWTWIFAFSQFIMVWVLSSIYVRKASSFDKEAKLWRLTEEDKRIAKEERLSPADYIEAEERDNDDLIDDD